MAPKGQIAPQNTRPWNSVKTSGTTKNTAAAMGMA